MKLKGSSDLRNRAKKRRRDDDRDISERVALGQAQPTSQALLMDSRLQNQDSHSGHFKYDSDAEIDN